MGCTVFGTSRTAAKLERARSLGLDVAIDTSEQDFVVVVRQQTSGTGVQVVPTCWELRFSRVISRHLPPRDDSSWSGRWADQGKLDLGLLLSKRLTVVGTTLPRPAARGEDRGHSPVRRQVVPWLERGVVAPLSIPSSRGKTYETATPGWRRTSRSARSFSGSEAHAAAGGAFALESRRAFGARTVGRGGAPGDRSAFGRNLAILDLQNQVVGHDEPAVVRDDDQGCLIGYAAFVRRIL